MNVRSISEAVDYLPDNLEGLLLEGSAQFFKDYGMFAVPDMSSLEKWMKIANEEKVMQCMVEEDIKEEERCGGTQEGINNDVQEKADMDDDGEDLVSVPVPGTVKFSASLAEFEDI